MSRAWLTPVIDSLLIIQMKKDPEHGADDLETFGLVMEAFGTVFYCVLGAAIWNEEKPAEVFWLIAATGAAIFIAGLCYPSSSDETDHTFNEMSLGRRIKTKSKLFGEALAQPEVRNILIFIFITSICAPNIEEYLIYFNEYKMVTPMFELHAEVVMFFAGAIIFMIYQSFFFSKSELHPVTAFAIVVRVISALFFAYDTAGRFSPAKTLMI